MGDSEALKCSNNVRRTRGVMYVCSANKKTCSPHAYAEVHAVRQARILATCHVRAPSARILAWPSQADLEKSRYRGRRGAPFLGMHVPKIV